MQCLRFMNCEMFFTDRSLIILGGRTVIEICVRNSLLNVFFMLPVLFRYTIAIITLIIIILLIIVIIFPNNNDDKFKINLINTNIRMTYFH